MQGGRSRSLVGKPAVTFGEAMSPRPTYPARRRDDPRSHSRVPGQRPLFPTVTVIIPTLNEAPNLPFVFSTLADLPCEIIVVDGRSSDDTERVATALRPDVRVLHESKPGKGAALQAGFAAATGDIIVMLDADGSADGREIPRFVAALTAGADFAKGTRFAPHGGSSDITYFRQLGNRCLNQIVNTLFGARFTDLCYGYNAFWRDCVEYLAVDCDGFEVETLLTIRATRCGLEVVEVPSYESGRIHGSSNLRALSDGWRVLRTILAERRRPDARPRGGRPLRPAKYTQPAIATAGAEAWSTPA